MTMLMLLMMLQLSFTLGSNTYPFNKTVSFVAQFHPDKTNSDIISKMKEIEKEMETENFLSCNFTFLSSNQLSVLLFNSTSLSINDDCSILHPKSMTEDFYQHSNLSLDTDFFLFSYNCSSLNNNLKLESTSQDTSNSTNYQPFNDPHEENDNHITIGTDDRHDILTIDQHEEDDRHVTIGTDDRHDIFTIDQHEEDVLSSEIIQLYVFFRVMFFIVHLLPFVLAFNINNRYYRTLGIVQHVSRLVVDVMICIWHGYYKNNAPFLYSLTITVIWSISKVISFVYPFIAYRGIGIYALKLKKKDIALITCTSLLSIGINIFIIIAYYTYDEMVTKIINSVLLPSNILIGIILTYIQPKEFKKMYQKAKKLHNHKINEIFDYAKILGYTSILYLIDGAFNPVIHGVLNSVLGFLISLFGNLILSVISMNFCFLMEQFDTKNIFVSDVSDDEPFYISS